MKLVSAKVGPFRSINTVQDVVIDPEVTVFVGMNEAGKTVFLKALHKSLDAMDVEEFDPVEDYPRKDYSAYMKRHSTEPEAATKLTYQLSDDLIAKINSELHTNIQSGFQFTVSHTYANGQAIIISVDESPVLKALASTPSLSTDTVTSIKKATTVRQVVELLAEGERTEADKAFLAELK